MSIPCGNGSKLSKSWAKVDTKLGISWYIFGQSFLKTALNSLQNKEITLLRIYSA